MQGRTKETSGRSGGLLLLVAFIATLACILLGGGGQSGETVAVGDVASRRYVATRDTVDQIATEKLKTEAANSVGPIYKNDTIAEDSSRKQVNDIFEELNDVLAAMGEDDNFYDEVQNASLNLPVVLTEEELSAYETLTRSSRILFAEDCIAILNQIYSEGISADELETSRERVRADIEETPWSDALSSMATSIVSAALEPNLVLDEDAMEAAREEKRSEVVPVQVLRNQKIVDEGEIITQDIYDRLVALGLVGGGAEGSLAAGIGGAVIAALIFGAMRMFFLWNKGRAVLKQNEKKMLFSVYIIMVLLIKIMSAAPYYTLIPLGFFGMMISILIGRRLALFANCFFGVIACMIYGGDTAFLFYVIISGSFGALMIQKTEKRAHMVWVALGMAAVNGAATLAIGVFLGGEISAQLLIPAGLAAIMGMLSVVIAVGSLPFWEGVFEANTPLRLLELTNPNNELLRRLMIEAPGTYHHSLIVANLAETAVYEIGGNTALARAGAYYHDIGKLKYPMYFAENQTLQNPHDDIEARSSARIITKHTAIGVEMGLENRLPKAIIDIIKEHHGTSLVKFFYFKALKTYGAESVNEEDYRYDGPVPSGRESAVVMLADTVEAAVRSMLGSGKTLSEAEDFIGELIKDKLDDGQLSQSGLAIHELEIIKRAFIKVFQGMYHERISYPNKEEIEAASKKDSGEKGDNKSDDTDR